MDNMTLTFAPARYLPFQDRDVIERVRQISLPDMVNHTWENQEFKLSIVPDARAQFVIDFTQRLIKSDQENSRLTVLLPGPASEVWQNVAEFCNKYEVSCRNLQVFFMNEWADEEGRVAPLDYEASYGRLFRKYFFGGLRPELRPPEEQIHYFTCENVDHYSDLIDETGQGGADICYSAVGWSGRLGAIEPAGDFICDSFESYLQQTSRIAANHMISIAEDSLLGLFGRSGDLAGVPPKSATIGPRDIAHARDHLEITGRTTVDNRTAWQCMSARLMLFGPVGMAIPSSILRLYKGTCFLSEAVAKDIVTKTPIPDSVTFAK